MKVSLVIGILLVACAQCFPTPSHVIKRADSEQEKQQLVNEMNEMRKGFAEKYKIANMQEMKWDSDLENTAGKTCTDSPGPNYQALSVSVAATENGLKKIIDDLSSMTEKRAEQELTALAGLITPTQNKLAIAEADCGEIKKVVVLIGPKSSIGEADFIKGEPGSKCDNGKASSGLCQSTSSNISNALFISLLILVLPSAFL